MKTLVLLLAYLVGISTATRLQIVDGGTAWSGQVLRGRTFYAHDNSFHLRNPYRYQSIYATAPSYQHYRYTTAPYDYSSHGRHNVHDSNYFSSNDDDHYFERQGSAFNLPEYASFRTSFTSNPSYAFGSAGAFHSTSFVNPSVNLLASEKSSVFNPRIMFGRAIELPPQVRYRVWQGPAYPQFPPGTPNSLPSSSY